MANENKYFDLNSMSDVLNKIAQREVEEFDAPYVDAEISDFQDFHEYDLRADEPVQIQSEEALGFSVFEIEAIEKVAMERGLDGQYVKFLAAVMDSINEEVNAGLKSKKEAKQEIEDYIDGLLITQATEAKKVAPAMSIGAKSNVNKKTAQQVADNMALITDQNIQEISQYAIGKGLLQEGINQIGPVIRRLNTEIQAGSKTKRDSMLELVDVIDGLLEKQGSQPVMTQPGEVDTMVETPEEIEDLPPQIQEEEQSTEHGETPATAEERGQAIVLPETVEEMGEEDFSQFPVSYEIGGKSMAVQNIYRITPQSDKFLSNFGVDALIQNPLFKKHLRYTSLDIKTRYHFDIHPDELYGAFYRNLMNALSIKERYDPRTDTVDPEKTTDFRLKIFADAPALVPVELYPSWIEMENLFADTLRERQQIRPGQQLIYDVTKSALLAQSEMAKPLIIALNKLINSKDPRILVPIYKEAQYLTRYEIGERERAKSGDKLRERQAPATENDSGDIQEVTDFGQETPAQMSNRDKPKQFSLKENQVSFGTSATMMKDFMDSVWENLSASVTDPKDYLMIEKIKLKIEMFKQQSKDLFQYESGKYQASKDRIYNENGEVVWNKPQSKIKIRLDDGTVGEFDINTQFSGMVGKKSFYDNYMNLLRLKMAIQSVIKEMNLNIDNPQSISFIKQRVSEMNPMFKTDTFQSFLSDPNFIKMTAGQSKVMAKSKSVSQAPLNIVENEFFKRSGSPDKQPQKLDNTMLVIWSYLAADSLISVAQGINKLNEQLTSPSVTETQKRKAVADFERARQNYLIFIGYHSSLLGEFGRGGKDVAAKLGENKKLKSLFGVSLEARDILQMIAGYKNIPAEIMDKLASHKYETANILYNDMLVKISKLRNIRKDIIRRASGNPAAVNKTIQQIIRNDLNKIKSIMR